MTADPVLLFDVMGTLVHDPFYDEVPGFFGCSLTELLPLVHPTAWVQFELDRISEADFLPMFFRDGRPYDQAGLKRTMHDGYRWIAGVEPLLQELVALGRSMHVLSNYTRWYRLIEQRTGLSRYLPWTFVSCETHVRKPDPEAYLGACRRLGVTPEACVFIDDRERNCEAARELGMDSIQATSLRDVRLQLVSRGLIASRG